MGNTEVLVVGGGVVGAGIAQAVAAAGYQVTLWERATLGGATSANSSKLIHGGLRYLESGQISLVKSCLAQRKALLKLAPDLVQAVPFYIPIYEDSRRGAMTIAAGLSLYAMLAKLEPHGRFQLLPKSQWTTLEGLSQQGLKHVFQYWDAKTNDSKLTRAVAASARALGADIREGVNCDAIYQGARVCQVTGHDCSGNTLEYRASLIINACGPWVNQLLERVTPRLVGLPIDWVQGSHLLLDIPPPIGVLYLESHLDERVVFVIPWEGKTLLGTTETLLTSTPEAPTITPQEEDYLLAIYCHYFNDWQAEELRRSIVQRFCGVRVLPKTMGSAFGRSRETIVHSQSSHPGIISVYGGKLTEYRVTAEQVLTQIRQRLGEREPIAEIARLSLPLAEDRLN
ncbi:MAG: FAD-dependent oxidoreductase [Shewanella sp.]|nr:FAD-dependent oxidoreductase [Shewanella sp.]MCF1431738.1 FAD-dependent oxidoreductase [Shewanella sp.]MCF1458529.1 FAD-dependent oxidoreductase [Shewanella sp.]